MQSKNIEKNFVILFVLILINSCGSVVIKDSEFCGDMGSLGASCFTTLSSKERELDFNDWERERFGMMCSTSSTFADWKKAIEKLCKKTRSCTFEQKKSLIEFGQNINKFQNKIK